MASMSGDEWGLYTRQLTAKEIDFEDRQISAGTAVLCNPLNPKEFLEDTTANRERFRSNDYAWSNDTRTRVWFGAAPIPDHLDTKFRAIEASKQSFIANLSANLSDPRDGVRGQPFPSIREPWWYAALPWEPAVRQVALLDSSGSMSPALVEAITRESGVPHQVSWPAAWLSALRSVNDMAVYRLSALGAQIDVVVAFVTPIVATGKATFDVRMPDAKCITIVENLYEQWAANANHGQARFTYFSLGADSPWAEGVPAVASGRHWIAYSSRDPDGRWHQITPARYGDRTSLSNFLDRLKPETRRQRTARIKDFVDDQLTDPHQTVDVDNIKKRVRPLVATNDDRFGYRQTAILESFADIQNRNPGYHIYKTKGVHGIPDGLIAIRKTPGKGDFHLRPFKPLHRAVWQVCIGFLIIIMPQGLGALLNWIGHGTKVQLSTFGISVIAAYGGSLVVKRLTRLREVKE